MKSKGGSMVLGALVLGLCCQASAFAQSGMSQLDFDRGAKKTKEVKDSEEVVEENQKSGLTQLSENVKSKKKASEDEKAEENIRFLTTDSLVKELQRESNKSTEE